MKFVIENKNEFYKTCLKLAAVTIGVIALIGLTAASGALLGTGHSSIGLAMGTPTFTLDLLALCFLKNYMSDNKPEVHVARGKQNPKNRTFLGMNGHTCDT